MGVPHDARLGSKVGCCVLTKQGCMEFESGFLFLSGWAVEPIFMNIHFTVPRALTIRKMEILWHVGG